MSPHPTETADLDLLSTAPERSPSPHRSGLFYACVVAFYVLVLVSVPLLLSVAGCSGPAG